MDSGNGSSEPQRPQSSDAAASGGGARRTFPRLTAIPDGISAGFGWIWTLIKAVPPSVLGFLSLWIFVFAPWLRPWEPPVERHISIADLVVGERDKIGEDGVVVNTVYVVIDAVGYDADDVDLFWLELDQQGQYRLDETSDAQLAQTLDFNTRTDRALGEIDVPVPVDHPGCIFVRVMLRVRPPDDRSTSRLDAAGDAIGDGMRWLLDLSVPEPREPALLDVADTAPFDPNDPSNNGCLQSTAEPPLHRPSEIFDQGKGDE